ncbi:hypothetical protein ABZ260_42375 [Streptosporangium sp. NPDC006013]|uniref:hypothetical protein n=1 Tax=Streptosporangium sp. NPDC006013 TaxID=3155596 RepID=UPI0033B84856
MRGALADDADRIAAAVDDLLELVDGGGTEHGWQLRAVALAEVKGRPALSGMQVAAAGLRRVHHLSRRTVPE